MFAQVTKQAPEKENEKSSANNPNCLFFKSDSHMGRDKVAEQISHKMNLMANSAVWPFERESRVSRVERQQLKF